MALIPLPDVGWRDGKFDPVYPSSMNQMEGRFTERQTFGTPFWRGEFITTGLTEYEAGLVDAFIMQATAPGNYILAGDTSRIRPLLEDRSKTPLAIETGNLSTITSPVQQTITNAQPGLRLSPGDYVEYRMPSGIRSLHRIMAPATASAAGTVTVTVQYPLDTQNFTTAAVARFEKPACVMVIDPGSYSATKHLLDRSASFSATEVFFS